MKEPTCKCGRPLPERERVRAVLDGATEHLNRAKLCDALHGHLPLASIQQLAMLAHAVLRASSMLERCEDCIERELARAARAVTAKLLS